MLFIVLIHMEWTVSEMQCILTRMFPGEINNVNKNNNASRTTNVLVVLLIFQHNRKHSTLRCNALVTTNYLSLVTSTNAYYDLLLSTFYKTC